MSLFNTINPSACCTATPRNEATRTEGSVQKPVYQVTESDDAYELTVNLPGVAKDGLEVTSDAGEIRVVGRRAWSRPKGWTSLHRESAEATYELVLTHENAINSEKIGAELSDGALQVTLPKTEKVKPRKITVN
jgi:HSP20 family molecular chaperone IbpA